MRSRPRFKAFQFVVILLSFVAIARLFYLQVILHNHYSAKASSQYISSNVVYAKRGEILSSDGYPLVSNKLVYTLYGEPQKIKDKKELINKILTALNIVGQERLGEFERMERVLNYNLYWVVLKRRLSSEEKERIERLNLNGIGFEEELIRFYPEGTLASHVLGYVAKQEDGSERGYFGVEGAFDGDLRGRPGKLRVQKDGFGKPILVGSFTEVKALDGKNIKLTIDRTVQYIIEKKLKEGVERYQAGDGVIIVMNPMDGSILGMAVYPNYDPSNMDFSEPVVYEPSGRKLREHKNLAISYLYEPGSVIKPLTVSAAIDMGLLSPQSEYFDGGSAVYSGHTIRNWDGKALGKMNLISLLQKSNNIGAAWVGHKVGAENLTSYFRKYGLGSLTGVDLEGEQTGIIKPPSDITDIDLATMSFGQGISATPLQVLNAFNAIVNGGVLYKPKILLDSKPKELGRVIKKETSDIMIDMLIKAVDGGEARYFNIKNYIVAGKTGTAQIPIPGGYDERKTNVTFVGFLPTSKKFSMLVKLREPQTSIYAAETAVPLWMETAGELVKYFSIPPDR